MDNKRKSVRSEQTSLVTNELEVSQDLDKPSNELKLQ